MKSRMTVASVLLVLSVLLAFPAAANAPYVQTCKYFDGVAYNDRVVSSRETFRMVLASDCRAALKTLLSAQSSQDAQLAVDFLDQLQLYRATLLRIAMERFAQLHNPGVRRSQSATGRPMVRPVSRTGAFLIAKSMGLVAKQREWTVWKEAQANP